MINGKIVPLSIIDWYDGVVLATVHVTWMEGTFVAALLYWDQPDHLRVYALLPTSAIDADKLASTSTEWTAVTQAIAEMFERATELIPVVCVDEETERVTRSSWVHPQLVAPLVPSDASESLSGERRAWLDVF